jgi:hypothetical protein
MTHHEAAMLEALMLAGSVHFLLRMPSRLVRHKEFVRQSP